MTPEDEKRIRERDDFKTLLDELSFVRQQLADAEAEIRRLREALTEIAMWEDRRDVIVAIAEAALAAPSESPEPKP